MGYRCGLQIISLILISKKVWVFVGFRTIAASDPPPEPPIPIASSSVLISPASEAIQVISHATFTPLPKSRNTCAMISST